MKSLGCCDQKGDFRGRNKLQEVPQVGMKVTKAGAQWIARILAGQFYNFILSCTFPISKHKSVYHLLSINLLSQIFWEETTLWRQNIKVSNLSLASCSCGASLEPELSQLLNFDNVIIQNCWKSPNVLSSTYQLHCCYSSFIICVFLCLNIFIDMA